MYTRLELKTDKYKKEQVSLSEIAESVCEDMALIRKKGITLTRQVQEGITCSGNQMLLTRLLVNLISNAYRYGKENGHILVKLEKNTDEIRLSVEDDGIGIPKSEQKRIFERFYRVDKSHSKEIGGTGLGLSIVKHAVSTLNGSIVLRSEEGSGTEITMKFLKVHKE